MGYAPHRRHIIFAKVCVPGVFFCELRRGANPPRSKMKRPLYWLLVFLPIAVWAEHAQPESHRLIFLSACTAIIPLAAILGAATEQIAARAGEGLGGFLNATFGNAAELIIAIVALSAGQMDVVK